MWGRDYHIGTTISYLSTAISVKPILMAQSAILNLLFLAAEQPDGLLTCEVYDSST